MAKLFDRMKKTLKDGLDAMKKGTEIVAEKTPELAATVAGKTQEAINIGKLKLQVQSLNHKVDKSFTEIGRKVYEMTRKKVTQIENDETVKKLVGEVNRLMKQIKDMEKKMESLKKEEQQKRKKPEAKPTRKKPSASSGTGKKPPAAEESVQQ
jgi:methyl-accepting chemotaxis protein